MWINLLPGDFSVKYFDHLSWLAWDIVALDVQDVIFIVDSDNLESDLFVDLAPHVSRHLLSRPDSGLVPSRPDATRPPVGLSRTTNIMTTTLETPTFHYALVASTRSTEKSSSSQVAKLMSSSYYALDAFRDPNKGERLRVGFLSFSYVNWLFHYPKPWV